MFVFFPAFSLTIKQWMLFQSLSNSFPTHCEYSSVDVIVSSYFQYMLVTWNNFLTAIYSFHGNKHHFDLTLIYPGRIQNPDLSISFRRMFKRKICEYYVKLNLGNERNGTLYHNSKKHFITNVLLFKTIWITTFFSSFQTFDGALDFCCPPIQSEERIQQLYFPSSKEKEEEKIWSQKEPVRGGRAPCL